MTQTPRDWQKDMEMAHKARYEYDISHLNNVLDSLFYWLQEAKRLEGLATGRGQAIIRKNREISELEARADAAEAREQQLQALLNDTLGCLVMYNGSDNEHVQRIVAAYRTLYPDTPAPKEREVIEVPMTLEYGGKLPKRPRIEIEEGDNQ